MMVLASTYTNSINLFSSSSSENSGFVFIVKSSSSEKSQLVFIIKSSKKKVKVPVWVDEQEEMEFPGVGARSGLTLESKEKRANQMRVVVADSPDCCRTKTF